MNSDSIGIRPGGPLSVQSQREYANDPTSPTKARTTCQSTCPGHMLGPTMTQHEASTLTPAQEAEMRRMDTNGDMIVDEVEKRAFARSSATLRASNMKYRKGLCARPSRCSPSRGYWQFPARGGHCQLVQKELKVEGVSRASRSRP